MKYHLLDENHIEILAGDLTGGIWNFSGDLISRDGETDLELKQTRSLEVRLRREVGRLDTLSDLPMTGLMGVATAVLWGPIGGLAATAVGMVAGKEEFLCIGCQLKDGRKFIANMRESVYRSWCKACPDARKTEKKKDSRTRDQLLKLFS